ncbi:MAG: pyridoxal phosphate-dependent aminotransferase family protein [Planctomycetota bacterium]
MRLKFDGREILSFASNDYLGLSTHPLVIAAAKAALERRGAGAGASPLIVGHKPEHAELESALAEFKQSAAALVFPSGYQAALASLGALAGAAETIILDRLAHASLLDGARLSGARVRTFKHNDVADMERLLEREGTDRNQPRYVAPVVVVESLYSMDGDAAPLAELAAVAQAAGALLLVDEAHATGVLGETGRGGLEQLAKEHGRLPEHVVAMGTLSKTLGSQGGFICASKLVIDTIVHSGRAYLFSTALAPASAAAAREALRLIDAEPQRRTHLLALSRTVRAGLAARKLNVLPGTSPIIPVMAGTEQTATAWSEALLRRGIYVPAIRYPTVKKGQARLRVSLSAGHTETDCAALLEGACQ